MKRSGAGGDLDVRCLLDYQAHALFGVQVQDCGRLLGAKEALIKSLSDFATSIMMQGKEKDDANSELFKESFDAVLHNYAAKSDSSI